jgi:hypothetical protein
MSSATSSRAILIPLIASILGIFMVILDKTPVAKEWLPWLSSVPPLRPV